MKHRSRILGVLAMSLAASSMSLAQPKDPTAKTNRARATLISDVSTFVPGKPFTVAIVFEIEPKWHLYYKEPGDSGLPPSIKWNLPEGMTAGEIQFPKPEVLKTPAGTNFVYHEKVALLVEMKTTDAFKIGRAVEISGALTWLECDADTCLPAKQSANLRVTADERATPNQKEDFEAWRAKVKEAESFDPAAAGK